MSLPSGRFSQVLFSSAYLVHGSAASCRRAALSGVQRYLKIKSGVDGNSGLMLWAGPSCTPWGGFALLLACGVLSIPLGAGLRKAVVILSSSQEKVKREISQGSNGTRSPLIP